MPAPAPTPPPRAFTQGVGTVFQFVGVTLFLVSFFACCGSALFSRDWAIQPGWEKIAWRTPSGHSLLTANQALTLAVTGGVVLGLALAGIGLGLQSLRKRTPLFAVAVAAFGTLFWLVQAAFAVQQLHSIVLSLITFALAVIFALLCGLAVAAAREMAKNPPPAGEELFAPGLPASAADSPEVLLARELAQRKARLEVEQKEIEALERRLKRRLEEK